MATLSHISQEEIVSFCENDEQFVKLLNKGRQALFEAPSQSEFRVYAILVLIAEDGTLSLVEGANTESGYIGGSICAERSAIAKLRFIKNPKIKHIGVVTDSDFPVSPGALCREYLMSHAVVDTPVIMANGSGDKISRCQLGELWLHPFIYRTIRRGDVTSFATNFANKMSNLDELKATFPEAVDVYNRAVDAKRVIKNMNIHPISFSAAVLYSNGHIETSYQINGIEYGCTVDAVTQLIHQMEKFRYCVPCGSSPSVIGSDVDSPSAGPIYPILLVMVDQYGVAHAPFAQARSLLSEHDYGEIKVLVHEEFSGKFALPTVNEIIPTLSHGCQLLSCNDFH